MKRNLFLSLPLLLIFICGKDPIDNSSTYTVYINYTDHSVKAEVLRDAGKIKPEIGHIYYWYMNNDIKTTDGGFDGRLLHGTYKCFYTDLNLKEQGEFVRGEKSGEWISWYQNGKLHEVSHYKNGMLSGKYELYDEDGIIKERSVYSNGELDGNKTIFRKNLPDSVIRYKNGVATSQNYRRKQKSLATKSSNSDSTQLKGRIKADSATVKNNRHLFRLKTNPDSTPNKTRNTRTTSDSMPAHRKKAPPVKTK